MRLFHLHIWWCSTICSRRRHFVLWFNITSKLLLCFVELLSFIYTWDGFISTYVRLVVPCYWCNIICGRFIHRELWLNQYKWRSHNKTMSPWLFMFDQLFHHVYKTHFPAPSCFQILTLLSHSTETWLTCLLFNQFGSNFHDSFHSW